MAEGGDAGAAGATVGQNGRKRKTKSSTYCCVPQCNNYASEGIRFHHFPKDKVAREAWRAVLKMGKKVTDSDRVCSEHFLPTDYVPQAKPTAVRYLKTIAVPSVKLPVRKHDRPDTSPQKKQKLARKQRAAARQSKSTDTGEDRSSESETSTGEGANGDDTSHEIPFEAETAETADTTPSIPTTKEKSTQSDKFSLLILLPDSCKLFTFTGVNSFATFENIVTCAERVLKQSAKYVLPVRLRVALCLTKLKLNMPYTALSVLFGVTDDTCSNYFRHTVQVLKNVLKGLVYFPSKEEILNNIPKCFRKYTHTRVVLDSAEVPVEKPKCLRERILTYSHYKGRYTHKFLVGVSPGGMITFLNPVLDLCEYGDGLMVDKGFRIDDECLVRNLRLIRPPFIKKKQPLSKAEALQCVDIAAARVHVERAIKQLRDFDILNEQVSGHLVPYMNSILRVCGALANLNNPILSIERF
ncbi:hypothetical protein FOCC_FOCC011974 [Frankliniella occidentalis]|nr:hypothetical protein FOCC_FOCC011974 [Frankliniella occidentalis]